MANQPLDRFPAALRAIGEVLESAALGKHSDESWSQRTVQDHLARACSHLGRMAAGDTSEPHLIHAATRLLMAIEIRETDCGRADEAQEVEPWEK
jgi:hypothetical protein